MSDSEDWWKRVPCHFIWELEENVNADFKGVLNNLDSKLETRNETEWRESTCDLLLFRGYIEVSDFDGVKPNPEKADEFFLKAEMEAKSVADDDECQAYMTVVTANRLWVLESFQDSSSAKEERSKLLTDLEKSWMRSRDECSRRRLDAFIDAIAAFALARLGPNKYKEAEERYQRALETIDTKSWWYQSLGAVIGRQGRMKFDNKDDRYNGIDEEIRYYQKAMELDPQNTSAKCDLALVLLRYPERRKEARDLMTEVEGTSSEVILKKGRFYRLDGDTQRALEILLEGENKLKHVRSDIYYQISLLYGDSANQLQTREEKEKKREYQMNYLNKCLEKEPSHFYAMIGKGICLCRESCLTRGLAILREVIQLYRSSPRNLIKAQYQLAETLFIHNNRTCNGDVAKAYEDAVDTGILILKNMDTDGNKAVRNIINKATERLEGYYSGLGNGHTKKQILHNKLSEIGVDE